MSGVDALWQFSLAIAVLISTAFTIFIITLPKPYTHFPPDQVIEEDFAPEEKQNAQTSGYGYYCAHRDGDGKLNIDSSVTVVVLGDIGRSPRMQYHALSIAQHGGRVRLIGYLESELHPDVQANRFIQVVPLAPYPKRLNTANRAMFPLIGPLKALWQVFSLYYALGYQTQASKFMLVQNPPSIPTLAVSQAICLFRKMQLVVDWHNFGYSILALRLGQHHPLVRISEWYEGYFSRGSAVHLAVSNAMVRVLKDKWDVSAGALHDRPPAHFQPLPAAQVSEFCRRLQETAQHAGDLEAKRWRLVVSSTSWTPDEDFSLLLDALVGYSSSAEQDRRLPNLLVIITGKGPQKAYYLDRIRRLKHAQKLRHVVITTAWLSNDDYAALLASADLGISLHTSSSGVDLPMKVVDMFGTGLPVAGWSKFEAWPELVTEGFNGRGFESADGLSAILTELFLDGGKALEQLRKGALGECRRRWNDEWMPVAGKLFRLKS